ncbi:Cytochrome P450, E-class, group I [Penicillium italicum]|uniref:Cytochrome P450, E-class, group I n=1 Tax=Penicillium italicum TaxID=40296 RepID=A0A0A2LC06_PENIT|nr:Cytochrome P450, E-class, group I [Penicillium italicum]
MESPEISSGSSLISCWLICMLGAALLNTIYRRLRNPLSHIPGPEISKWTEAIYTYNWLNGKTPMYVHQLHEKYGPIVRISPDQIDICDTNAVKEIHKTNSRFAKTDFYRKLTTGDVPTTFSTADRNFHTHHRRLLASPISDSSLTHLEPLIANRVRVAVDKITMDLKDHGATDVFKWWLFMATDIIGELTFGDSFRMLEVGKKNQYSLDMERLIWLQPFRTTFPLLVKLAAYIPVPIIKDTARTEGRLTTYAVQSVDRYKELISQNPSNPKPTLFTKLFDEKSGMSYSEIIQEAQGYIIAGSDTTAVTMTYLTYAVCRDSRVRDKLVAELAGIPEPVTDKSLRDLPYLNQVISETLRLYTAVPFGLPRLVPPEGAQFNGYHVPGGITVSTQAYSLHRDLNIFPEPDSFHPERWENPTKEMKDASLPFGGGSRICLGMHLARMELRLATALFFRALPNARPSTKQGMTANDMEMLSFFLMAPQGHRCIIET